MVIPVYDGDGPAGPGFRAWIVWCIFAINVVAFLFLMLLPEQVFLVFGYNFGIVPAILTGHADGASLGLSVPPGLGLVTYTFLHANWLHLTANMIVLWVFGDDIEAATGHLRFLLFFFLCGTSGALLHILADPQSMAPVVGASGAVSGVVGAYLLLRPKARVTVLVLGLMTVTLRAYWVIAFWIAWQAFNVWWPLTETGIAYWTHLGGFAAGLILIALLRRKDVALLA